MKKELLMKEALVQAKKALKKGEVPIGAVVVLGDEIIGKGHNQPITKKDPTAHAEIIALKEASNRLDNYRLNEAIIYTTLEPCLMCAGALVHARIKKIIFATQDTKSGVVVNNGGLIQSEFLNHKVSFEGGILEKQASKLLKDFFLEKRS
jgi:tRNA(adenine34) deaminase